MNNVELRALYEQRIARQAPKPISVDIVDEDAEFDRWTVELIHRPGAHLGSHVWESSVVLAAFLRRHVTALAKHIDATTVLELGSGCGLAGIAAAYLLPQCRVVLTDHDKLVPLLQSSIDLQPIANLSAAVRIQSHSSCNLKRMLIYSQIHNYQPFDWNESIELLPSSDIIIAADVIYHPDSVMPLARTVLALASSAAKLFILAYRVRHAATEQPFFDRLFELHSDWMVWCWDPLVRTSTTSCPFGAFSKVTMPIQVSELPIRPLVFLFQWKPCSCK
jgi:predicted nicotinamide N-methyase